MCIIRDKLNNFLIPTKLKLSILVIFLLLGYLAIVQSWAFCKECSPKPFLYDFINEIPIWPLAMYALLPVLMPLNLLGLGFLNLPVALIYAYLLACVIDFAVKKLVKK
ncbi:MAG: hypothetical protein COT15_03870 [Candidatus Diapherotrites archaeon CG08_land_8_20_14_0_20_34_12]|nr:MAG: hypothetical protein COT15_03870 [Candidatus Diapherotrites archaeon CG08_land_8_20_14_0_20_34_12]